MLIHFIHGYYCIYRPWQPLTYLYFPYHCISLIYFSFTMIRMFLYAHIYWLAEFGDVSCLQFNYLRAETLTPTWENLVGQFGRTLVGHLSVWSPTKLSVRPECLIVDTLGGICTYVTSACDFYYHLKQGVPEIISLVEDRYFPQILQFF
jgi:hypothetical protein